ncbi:uncharacterized protein BXZ73DRAFT_38520 [Epithele typhae]|uniref:uncharacterized protein n=1 Tax=Epithele typhae TaxID=378194 RepID=UPI002007BF8E|nr:uncharacterized protein BXZ73DRAFT_38520 [Epithele typhae]KAH9945199.1 hypothetical protein BXZ73DRAFT_38520 [Epithele typhae]
MLGQRIIDHVPGDWEVHGTPHSGLAPAPVKRYSTTNPSTGLPLRRAKSSGLRILTDSGSLWSDNPRGHLNPGFLSANRHSLLSVRTPDTSHTFGQPNPSMMSPKHPPTSRIQSPASTTVASPSSAALAARRHSRYSIAESALRTAAEVSSTELSPAELQVRALSRATALLSEQARDAQTTAAKLRAALVEKEARGLAPEQVRSLQREFWLEERRTASRMDQTATTHKLLTALCSPINEVPPPLVESPATMTRAEANLRLFLRQSPTHVVFPTARISTYTLTRRKTISQVQPMRLRTFALEEVLRSPIKSRKRSTSLGGQPPPSPSPEPVQSRRDSASTDVTCVSQDPREQTATATTLKVAVHNLAVSEVSPFPSPLSAGPHGGIVRIEPRASLRPRDTILSEVGDVSLPDYVADLLEDFGVSKFDITLPCAPSSPAMLHFRTSIDSYGSRTDDLARRASLSMPEFRLFPNSTEASHEEPRPPQPHSPSILPPSLIIDRLRNVTEFPASSSTTPSPPGSLTAGPSSSWGSVAPAPALRRRPSKQRSTGSVSLFQPKFSSPRLSTPSLFTVPEDTPAPESRPQSSLSTYCYSEYGFGYGFGDDSALESPEARLERAGYGTDSKGVRRRFFTVPFRRRRSNSGPALAVQEVREQERDRGPADAGESESAAHLGVGVLARVRRRLSARREGK